MKLRYVLMLIMLACAFQVRADESVPVLPPNPHTLLTDAATLIDFELDDFVAVPDTPYLVGVVIARDPENSEQQQFIVRVNPDTWQTDTVPAPDGTSLNIADKNLPFVRDGQLYLTSGYHSTYYADEMQVWMMDMVTLALQPYVPPCPGVKSLNTLQLKLAFDRGWLYIPAAMYHPDEPAQHCTLSTGESTPIIVTPEPFADDDYKILSESADKRWLIQTDATGNGRIYSYDTTTGRRNFLGEVSPYFYVTQWVGDDVLILQFDMPEWSSDVLYRANIHLPHSLHEVVARYRFSLNDAYLDNPPRYDFVSGNEGGDFYECSRIIYDINADKLTWYDLDYMCEPDYGTLDGVGYYRNIVSPWEMNPTPALVRFNPLTGERENLYRGEIEWIAQVSPDEKYAVLVLDDSGEINTPPFMPPPLWGQSYDPPEHPQLSLVNLKTGKTLFQLPADWDDDLYYPQFFASLITQLDDDEWIAVNAVDDYQGLHLQLDKHGYLTSSKMAVNHIDLVLPETRSLIYHDDSGTFYLRDIDSGQDTALMTGIDLEQSRVTFMAQDANTLAILVEHGPVSYDWYQYRLTLNVRLNGQAVAQR